MKKSYSVLCLIIAAFAVSYSFADGMIITFEEDYEEIVAQNDGSDALNDPMAPENKESEKKPAKDEETPSSKEAKSTQATDQDTSDKQQDQEDTLIETKPPVLEKKDFLPDHKETAPVDSYEKTFMQTLLVLIGLLVLILLGVWLIRKFSGGRMRQFNTGKTIKILERRPLSHKSMLYLVDIRGRQFLIAESQLEVTRISSLDWLDEEKEI
ncbi:MAG: hypothetical protein Tsb0015_11230 [Simkaniaceae bacterium]